MNIEMGIHGTTAITINVICIPLSDKSLLSMTMNFN